MIRRSLPHALLLLLLALVALGCGSGGRPKVKTAKVSGTITMDGKPLDGAQVNFLGAEFAGVATTDSNGQYATEAQPGENKIYVLKYTGVGPEFDETMIGAGSDMPGSSGGPKQIVPKKFSDPFATELKFTVPDAGSDAANFELTSR